MKKLVVLLSVLMVFGLLTTANADLVDLYVDSAPNVYGSPNYAPWWTNAQSTAAAGTFVNMANSYNPANSGTTNMEINDLVVYSFGDLGKRLHFVYWIPNETLSSLAGRFLVSMYYQWDGVWYDFYDDYYGSTWLEPTRWEDYNGGVVGTAGFAWWGAYGVNTPEALAADLAEWNRYQGDILFVAKLVTGAGEQIYEITAHHTPVPIPGAVWLLGSGLAGLGLLGRRRFFKR